MVALFVLLAIAALVGVDQLSKWLIYNYFQVERQESPLVIIDGIVSFVYHPNQDGAFGMFPGMRWLLIGVTSLMLIALLVVLVSGRFRDHRMAMIGGVLVVAGGIGNLIDRIFREGGAVVDFIHTDFVRFPTFNVADCFVVIGAILLFVYFVFFYSETPADKASKKTASKEVSASDENDSDGSADSDGAED